MDSLACHVIYVNRSVGEARLLRALSDDLAASPTDASPDWQHDRVRDLVQPLLDAFGDGLFLLLLLNRPIASLADS
jgi:hypothetical protein